MMRKNYGQLFIEFLLFSNFWVALTAGVLSAGFNKHIGYSEPLLAGTFTFCCTYIAYNFHRLVKIYQLKTVSPNFFRLYWQKNNLKFIYLSSIICIITSSSIYSQLWGFTFQHVGYITSVIGVTLFYVLPIPGINLTLRSIPMNKIVWITLTWLLLLAFPSIMEARSISTSVLITCALWVCAQSIPFDIRDLAYDSKELKTIPQLVGSQLSRVIVSLLVLFPFILDNSLVDRPIYMCAIAISLIGSWIPITSKSALYLELIWEGALLVLGLHYWFC